MATAFEKYTTEEQRSVVLFLLWAKRLNAKDIHKEMFPVYGRKHLSRKAVHNFVEKYSHDVRKWQMMPDQVRKWLRQQSKLFYDAGLDALVKRWDKCINVGEEYAEKQFFFVSRLE
jgi:hypothetical protein